jgi:hypothetical protein
MGYLAWLVDQIAERIITKMSSLVKQYTDAVEASFAALQASLANIKADVENLNAKITELMNAQPVLSTEDAALLQGVVDAAAQLTQSAAAVDAMTPPPAPPPAG